MDAESTWCSVINNLLKASTDVATVPSNKREPLWFFAFIDNGNLYVENSGNCMPSTKLSQRRKITKSDFLTVYSYYHRWANGERHLRQEVRTLSRNTAYIFGLINRYEK